MLTELFSPYWQLRNTEYDHLTDTMWDLTDTLIKEDAEQLAFTMPFINMDSLTDEGIRKHANPSYDSD